MIAVRSAGFTLVEAIVVMVITGIIAAVVGVFITRPVQGYMDSVRRAQLTDAADTALRRLARDIRLALPNSLRLTTAGGNTYIEFIMTRAGGRYRDQADGSAGGDALDFSNGANKSFDVLGPMPSPPLATGGAASGDYLVVHNLGPGYEPADAYSGGNRAQVDSVSGNTVTLVANPYATQAPPLPSASSRFQVVPFDTKAVSYECPLTVSGAFRRHWNYGFNASQVAPPVGGSSSLLVGNATCAVSYEENVQARFGLISITLTLTEPASGEAVSLFHQIHVDNSP